MGIWLLGPEKCLSVQVSSLAMEWDSAEDHAGHPPDPVTVSECSKYPCPPYAEPNLYYKWLNWGWGAQSLPWPFPVSHSKFGSLSQTGQVGGRKANALLPSIPRGTPQPGQLGEGCWKRESSCAFRIFTRTSLTTTSPMPRIGSPFLTRMKLER